MGTNFYWKKMPSELKNLMTPDNRDIILHIGKRVGAGMYCMDCGTQVKGEQCHICYKESRYVCKFIWTFMKQKKVMELYKDNFLFEIEDEYGDKFTIQEFLDEELKNCFIEEQVFERFA